MRKYKCESCGGFFDHFAWRYDYSPRGDDVSFCPLCGCEEPDVEEVEVEEDVSEYLRWERLNSFYNGQYVVKEVRCPICHHKETFIGTAPEYCFICNERRL